MKLVRLIETYIVTSIGGYLFSLANTPLPWVLGALTFIAVWQAITKREVYIPGSIKNSGFVILGINFGLFFTAETFQTVSAYFFPYLISTIFLIAGSIILGMLVTKWINVDPITSVFSSIPGGLSEMVLASESLNAKTSYVTIFQTIRLITVLFVVPSVMTYFFGTAAPISIHPDISNENMSYWNYLWFIIPAGAAMLIQKKVPAGIIIGALGVTAFLNVTDVNLPEVPEMILHLAQISIGAVLGSGMNVKELVTGGKYSFVYFGLSLLIILISFALGTLLAVFTTLNFPTAILSIAPGGLFEMVLTGYSVGADPAIVSALQLVRILVIVLFVPSFLKWWFKKREYN